MTMFIGINLCLYGAMSGDLGMVGVGFCGMTFAVLMHKLEKPPHGN